MKVAVVGSRKFKDIKLMEAVLLEQLWDHTEDCINPYMQIYSGGARGADKLAEQFAENNIIPFTVLLPNWNKYKKAAGIYRNLDLLEKVDKVIAFWDGTSPGTKHMIHATLKAKKELHVCFFEG